MFAWLRRLLSRDHVTKPWQGKDAERGPDWRIETPYGEMEGYGLAPYDTVYALRVSGIPTGLWVDGTGNGLRPEHRRVADDHR